VDEGVLFKSKCDFEEVVVGTSEIDSDGGDGNWFLGLGETKLDHESV
jgi:hypothetical protein